MRRYLYPYEIEVIMASREETFLSKPYDPKVIELSRDAIRRRDVHTKKQSTYVPNEDDVTLLQQEIDVTREEAIEALQACDDDVYGAAHHLIS